ncbi:MAG: hypothetical protein H8E32_03395 [Nitrospinae bacterium]|nr:hypothetical protein [Nitrospinota bacterium]
MKSIKRNSLVLTLFSLFSFLCFSAIAHAGMGNENCSQILKKMKVPVNGAMAVQKAMHKTFKSDQLIDRYNRHVNILVGNLDRAVSKMEGLLGKAEAGGCDQLVKKMRDPITSTKNIYHAMMESILLPTAKESLAKQNNKLKSELDHLLEIH